MALLFIAPNRNKERWKKALLNEDPNLDLYFWPDIDQPEAVNFAVCWDQPSHVLNRFPNLRVVASLGAGVDHILNDPQLPDNVTVCRTMTPRLKREMVDYIRTALLMHQRNIPHYIHGGQQGKWEPKHNRISPELEVGIMGLGSIGQQAAKQLADEEYNVRGWSRSKKPLDNVTTYAGDEQRDEFLADLDVLVCLLPLTDETEGILDLDVFKQIDNNALLINIARGRHLVDEDLIYALDRNLLNWAMLDVFEEEPLPDQHPFWNRHEIVITPHTGGITPPGEAAEIIVENYKRAISGMELLHTIDPRKGY